MFLLLIENNDDRLKVERLYKQYKYLMFSQANKILNDKYLSEDAVHQSFVRIIKNLHKIDENNCPRTGRFLVIICENIAKNIYNNRLYLNTRNVYIEEIDDKEMELCSDPIDIVIDKESFHIIEEAIGNLPFIYRDILHLKKAYDCTNQEIVDLLDIPLETVKKRLHRARKKLVQALMKERLK